MNYPDFLAAIHSGFATAWAAEGTFPYSGGTVPAPKIKPENGSWNQDGSPFIELDLIAGDGENFGTADAPRYHHNAILQVSMYVPEGWGILLLARMRNRASKVIKNLAVTGLRTYTTSVPRDLPQPPDGYVGKECSTPILWISQDDDA